MQSFGRLLRWLPALVGVAFVGAYLYIALDRVAYPFEIEWMEGGSVDHVARVLGAQPLYVAPTVDFVPYIYTPFYYYVTALVSFVTGLSLLPLRLVSFAATLATFVLITELVRRETDNLAAGLAATGLYAAFYPVCGYWMELARVDSLALTLVLAGAFLLRWHASSRATVIAGALFALAYLTKQTMLFAFVPLVPWVLVARGWKAAARLSVSCGAVLGVGTAWFCHRSGPWYFYYTLELPQKHPIWWPGWQIIRDCFLVHSFFVLAFGAALISAVRQWRLRSFYLVLLVATLGTSTLSMMHSGAAANVLLPGAAGSAVTFGLAVALLCDGYEKPRSLPYRIASVLGLLLCTQQLADMRYPVSAQRMTANDLASGRSLIAQIAALPGEVYIPNHGYLATMAGKPTHAQGMAVSDILRSSDVGIANQLRASIAHALDARRFSALVENSPDRIPEIAERRPVPYRYERDLLAGRPGFQTRTGLLTRPSFLYVLKPQ